MDYCITNPSNKTCVNYQYPNNMSNTELSSLCGMYMTSCSIRQICSDNQFDQTIINSTYCQPFSLLKSVCTEMFMKPDCNNYGSMCMVNNTVIAECQIPILSLPMPSTVEQNIKSICDAMNMEACSECNSQFSNCDVLQVYSKLCLVMPNMVACSDWKTLCNQLPGWPICPGGSEDTEPILRMYFHTGLEDYVLVKQWVPRTYLQYLLTALFIVCLGISFEGMKMIRDYFEMKWRSRLIKEARSKKRIYSQCDTC